MCKDRRFNRHLWIHNSGYKHQNNPFVSAEPVRYSSTYMFLCEDTHETYIKFKWASRKCCIIANISQISDNLLLFLQY